MSYLDCYSAERLMDLRVREERRQAELRRLQREAQQAHEGWLSRQRCWVLCQVGRFLVSLGVRLLQAGLAQPQPA